MLIFGQRIGKKTKKIFVKMGPAFFAKKGEKKL